MSKHQTVVFVWILLVMVAILVILFAPGIWTTGSLLFLVFVSAFDHIFARHIPKM